MVSIPMANPTHLQFADAKDIMAESQDGLYQSLPKTSRPCNKRFSKLTRARHKSWQILQSGFNNHVKRQNRIKLKFTIMRVYIPTNLFR